MTNIPSCPESASSLPTVKKFDWWQRLVEVERGLAAGFRANSALFFYFFTTSVLLSFSVVLELSGTQWAVVLLATSLAIGSELLCFCIRRIGQKWDSHLDDEIRQYLSIAAAACMLMLVGAIVTIVVVLGDRLCELYG